MIFLEYNLEFGLSIPGLSRTPSPAYCPAKTGDMHGLHGPYADKAYLFSSLITVHDFCNCHDTQCFTKS